VDASAIVPRRAVSALTRRAVSALTCLLPCLPGSRVQVGGYPKGEEITNAQREPGRSNDIQERWTAASGPSATVRLLVVDDCELKRLGTVAALEGDADIRVVGETNDWSSALEIARGDLIDVAVVDPHIAGSNGLSALPRLQGQAADIPVIAVSSSDRAEDLLEAVSAGVRGYVGRTTTASDLRAAIKSVHAGGTVIAPEVAGHLLRHVRAGEPAGTSRATTSLSPREREVLRLVTRGHTQDEIARDLDISERTVQLVLARLRQKTGLRRRSELMRWAAEQDVR
jgi:DNA-binding NarL/FixJ family response regulator